MKSNSKLVRAAIRLWPKSHRRYEEMCALAATAQLGGKEMSELNAHISTCDSCREFLFSVGRVSVQWHNLHAYTPNREQKLTARIAGGDMRVQFTHFFPAELGRGR